MDILSLPNEMLSNVLKYNKYSAIIKPRKINKRIDILAKRANLCERIPVVMLELIYERFASNICRYYFDSEDATYFGISKVQQTTFYSNFPQIPSKYVISKMFKLSGVDWGTEESIISTLNEQKTDLRTVKSVHFLNNYSAFPLTTFSDIFPKIQSLKVKSYGSSYVSSTEILRGRNWFSLVLELDANDNIELQEETLDDSLLNEVIVNCKMAQLINIRNAFTLKSIVKLIRTCQELDGRFSRQFDFGLMNLKWTVVQLTLSPTFFPGIRMKVTLSKDFFGWTRRECEVTFENAAPESYVRFVVGEIDNWRNK